MFLSLLKAFFIGIPIALGALVLEFILIIFNPSLLGSIDLMTLAVFIEEFLKIIVIQKIATKKNFPSTIFFQAFFIGVGFSLTEITLNIFSYSSVEKTFFWSYIGLFLIHTFTTTFFGYFLVIQKKSSFLITALIFSMAFLIHFFFNFAILHNLNLSLVYFILFSALAYLFFKNNFLPD